MNTPAFADSLTARARWPACLAGLALLLSLAACQGQPAKQPLTAETEPHPGGSCRQTSNLKQAPASLSHTCLYQDIDNSTLNRELTKFTLNYPLWSDGAGKDRWVYLPPGQTINSQNPDRWIFPVGPQFFKEFRRHTQGADSREVIIETRHMQKIAQGSGLDAWRLSSYRWNQEQTQAYLLSDGALDD